MDNIKIVKTISKAFVVLAFWLVFFVSLVLTPDVTLSTLAFILAKSLLVCAVLWILLVIIVDALVKTMMADAAEKEAHRIDGGLSYHLIKPGLDEISVDNAENSPDKSKKAK